MPEEAKAARADAIIATGRSDYPNQVNNVLCFPFLFRGALDCGATEINEAMKAACVRAIADLASVEPPDIVRSAYGGQHLKFGSDYLIPKPFDPRLMVQVAPAVALAAMQSGVAERAIQDMDAYRQRLQHHVFRSGMTMKPVFEQAQAAPTRVVFAEGEQDKVLEVTPQILEQGIARPILVGRRAVIEARIAELGLDIVPVRDFALLDPEVNPHFDQHRDEFYRHVKRGGYSPEEAAEAIRHDATALAATLLRTGEADAMLCGTVGRYFNHLERIKQVVGIAKGGQRLTAMNALVLHSGTLFIADTYVQLDPDAAALEEITRLCAREVRHFGIEPKVALLSHSNFGSHDDPSAVKMHDALRRIRLSEPELEIEGEMRGDLALIDDLRGQRFPDSLLEGRANLIIMPNQDAANIAFNLLRILGEGIAIGPLLLGAAKSAHIVTPTITVRGLLNMTALAAVKAQSGGGTEVV